MVFCSLHIHLAPIVAQQREKARERGSKASIQCIHTNSFEMIMGSYLVRWLISNIIICHRWANGWTEEDMNMLETIHSEMPIYKIHIPCMAWPFPHFPLIPMAYNLPAVNFGFGFIYIFAPPWFVRVTLPFCGFEFLIMLFLRLRCCCPIACAAVRYHHTESIETLLGNSIVIYWLPIDLLQRHEQRCEKLLIPETRAKTRTWTKKAHKVPLNPFCWITGVFMHLIESNWICIRHRRTFCSVPFHILPRSTSNFRSHFDTNEFQVVNELFLYNTVNSLLWRCFESGN